MKRWLVTAFGLLAIPGASEACSPDYRIPGQPVSAPYAVFDARVIELREESVESDGKSWPLQTGSLQVTRSLHGPHRIGDIVPTRTDLQFSCADRIEVGWIVHVDASAKKRPPYYLASAGMWAYSIFNELDEVDAEPRQSERPMLAGVTMRGRISDRAAEKLMQRAQPRRISDCEVRRSKHYAQVSCGRAYDGNDSEFKVIFERVNAQWKEVMRYQVPAA